MAEAFGIVCHELVSLDFRCGSTIDIRREKAVVAQWVCARTRGSELRWSHLVGQVGGEVKVYSVV